MVVLSTGVQKRVHNICIQWRKEGRLLELRDSQDTGWVSRVVTIILEKIFYTKQQ